MKVRNQIMALAGAMVGILSIVLVVAAMSFWSLTEAMHDSLKKSIRLEANVNEVRHAQVNFQRQVQEWKNILIRGNDAEAYKKYLDGFNKREKDMDDGLTKVKKQLSDSGFPKSADRIDQLLSAHRDLGQRYRAALNSYWNNDDPETGKKVDVTLRGIDRDTSKRMDELSDDLQSFSEKELNGLVDKAKSEAKSVMIKFIVAGIVALIAIFVVAGMIAKNILGLIGGEPKDMAEVFKSLANGEFDKEITLRNEKDRESMAVSAILMQRKVRNMVLAIKNGAKELADSSDEDNQAAMTNEEREKAFKSGKIARKLLVAVDRFKV